MTANVSPRDERAQLMMNHPGFETQGQSPKSKTEAPQNRLWCNKNFRNSLLIQRNIVMSIHRMSKHFLVQVTRANILQINFAEFLPCNTLANLTNVIAAYEDRSSRDTVTSQNSRV